jgi:hypothetical protein
MTLTIPLKAADGATSTITLPDPVVSSGTTVLVNLGQTAILTNLDNGNGNLLVAQPITLTQTASLQSLSFYVKTAAGQLRLGLYSGTTPTTLISQCAAFTAVAGWNTRVATSGNLVPGQYWIAYLPSSNTLSFENVATGFSSYFKTFTFGALPTTFPTGPSTTPSQWSFYGTFSQGPPPPPDTIPPSIPTGLTAVAR